MKVQPRGQSDHIIIITECPYSHSELSAVLGDRGYKVIIVSDLDSACEYLIETIRLVIVCSDMPAEFLEKLSRCVAAVRPHPPVWLLGFDISSVENKYQWADRIIGINYDPRLLASDVEMLNLPLSGNKEAAVSRVTQSARCLVVDDEEEVRDFLAKMLMRKGFDVETAMSGLEALVLIGQRSFDIVLCDVNMPGMNGIDTVRRIKRKNPRQIIVLMTGNLKSQGIERLIDEGTAIHCLHKPFDPVIVARLVDMFIERKDLSEQFNAYSLNPGNMLYGIFSDWKKAGSRFIVVSVIISVLMTVLVLFVISFWDDSVSGTETRFESMANTLEGYLKREEERDLNP